MSLTPKTYATFLEVSAKEARGAVLERAAGRTFGTQCAAGRTLGEWRPVEGWSARLAGRSMPSPRLAGRSASRGVTRQPLCQPYASP
ncbi:hypothetical protein MINTM001_23330 [Mycobacterium paraintracellulare]|nr:hypothetical protein MINTM001_23330 [Mycobacterium paraintracellulare]